MTRLFIDEDLSGRLSVAVRGELAHYLLGVLRCRPGFRFVAVDASGRELDVTVTECREGEVTGQVVAVREPAALPTFELHLYQALLKAKGIEPVIQKSVELGVSRVVPMVTERTVVRPDEARVPGRVDRWRKIAREACRQCGRAQVPAIEAPLDWAGALRDWARTGTPGVIPYEALSGTESGALRQALGEAQQGRRLAVFVGPEGGFGPSEIEQAREAGLRPVSLGPRILRAQTAAIAVCTIAMYELECR